jgi:hypothetical protein
MSDNNNSSRKKTHNLVDTTKLTSIEDAKKIIGCLAELDLCRPNIHGEIVLMKNPLIQMASGIRRSLKANGKSRLPTDIDQDVLEDDKKLVLACLSMFYHYHYLTYTY